MANPLIWNGKTDIVWFTKAKTADVFTITTAEELAGLAELVNNGNTFEDKTIVLGADIALNNITDWENWNENTEGLMQWTAIGYDNGADCKPFKGTFDGNGHAVSGIYINKPNDDDHDQGLFGYVDGGSEGNNICAINCYENDRVLKESGIIKNLGVIASYINGYYRVGCLVGDIWHGTIINSYATGNVLGGSNIGGLIGYVTNCAIISSYAMGSVFGGDYCVGGLAGRIDGRYGSNKVINCYATGNVSGGEDVGGLIGEVYVDSEGEVSNSYATGNVEATGKGESGGGLVGHNYYGLTISNCYATGNVFVDGDYANNIGGLVGANDGGVIVNSYATGKVSAKTVVVISGNGMLVGGLVGDNSGKIINSYAIGKVSVTVADEDKEEVYVGGLVGVNYHTTNCYYNTETSGQNDTGKGDGKTTEQMRNKNTYVGWDFEKIWGIDISINDGMPYLK
jgi:hypothetical protein